MKIWKRSRAWPSNGNISNADDGRWWHPKSSDAKIQYSNALCPVLCIDKLQEVINQLQENNSSLISTIQLLANLVSSQSTGKEKKAPGLRKNQETNKKVDTKQGQHNPLNDDVRQNLNLKGIKERTRGEQEKTALSHPRAPADRPETAIIGNSTLKIMNGNQLSKRLETKG